MGKNGKAYVFGEIHGDPGSSVFVANAIESLKGSGERIQSLALEVPVDAQESFIGAVNDPRRADGNRYEFESNGNRLAGLGGFIDLARKCQDMGMEVHCVDAPRRPGNGDVKAIQKLDEKFSRGHLEEHEYVRKNQDLHQRRNEFMADRISSIGGSVAVVVGMYHTGGPGGLESHLRDRGMSVSTMDVYPPNANIGGADIFARHESPQVDVRASSMQPHPTPQQIGSMIENLRGTMGAAASAASKTSPGFSIGPLRKSIGHTSEIGAVVGEGLQR
jgi:hypothetical protein